MFCTKCRKQIPGEGIFCSECETSISGRTDSYPTESECGKEPPEQQSAFDTTMDSPRSIENLIDNAWNTFNKNRHVDEPNLMQIDFNSPNTLEALQRIMGSGYYYYLPRFQQIQTYGKSSYNFYSLVLGLLHAGYRNVWRAFLEKMKYPYLICIIINILWFIYYLSDIESIDYENFEVMLDSADTLMTIVCFIYLVIFASDFDKIYMRHVQQKLLHKDFSPDEDIGRGLIVFILFLIIIGLPQLLLE